MQRFHGLPRARAATAARAGWPETECSMGVMLAKINGQQVHDPGLPLHHCGLNSLVILHLRSSIAEVCGVALGLTKF